MCLFGIEAIERLRADGHPVGPGSVGENLTTTGIDWSLLPVGTRARIGTEVVLEVASSAAPCATQRPNFTDGRFSRISIELFPTDARMYARVIQEGHVRAGDPIEILPAPPDSRAEEELVLDRLDWVAAKSALVEWRTHAQLGADIRIFDDGELVMAAVPGPKRSGLSHAFGLARLPNLVDDARRFYDEHGAEGCLITEAEPWPGSEARPTMDVFAADPALVADADGPPGLRIEAVTQDNVDAWVEVRSAAGQDADLVAPDDLGRRLVEARNTLILVAFSDDLPVGAGRLHVGHRTGWLRGGVVVPAARGRGIQRALIAARARAAAGAGCDLIGSWAETGSVSGRNLAALGFARVGTRQHHRYVPAGAFAEPVA